jgi:hypothetical protein
MGRGRIGWVLAAFAVVLSGCSGAGSASASWRLADGQQLEDSATTFTALVSRAHCNGGETGTVNPPDLRFTETSIIVTFTVSPGDPESAACPDNNEVPFVVHLDEPVGPRAIVDGYCERSQTTDTAPCSSGDVRRAA